MLGLICISLISDTKHHIYLLAIHMSSLEKLMVLTTLSTEALLLPIDMSD